MSVCVYVNVASEIEVYIYILAYIFDRDTSRAAFFKNVKCKYCW